MDVAPLSSSPKPLGWGTLPHDILQEVCDNLNCEEDWPRLRLVCRDWRDAVSAFVQFLDFPIMPPRDFAPDLLARLQSSFRDVRTVTLHHNQATHPLQISQVLQGLHGWNALRQLRLRDNVMWSFVWDIGILATLPRLASLTVTFEVAGDINTEQGCGMVEPLQRVGLLTNLEQLWITVLESSRSGSPSLCLGVSFLQAMSGLQRLTELSSNCINVSDPCVSALAALRGLQALTLSGDMSFLSLSGLQQLLVLTPGLAHLDLGQRDYVAAAPGPDAGQLLRWTLPPQSCRLRRLELDVFAAALLVPPAALAELPELESLALAGDGSGALPLGSPWIGTMPDQVLASEGPAFSRLCSLELFQYEWTATTAQAVAALTTLTCLRIDRAFTHMEDPTWRMEELSCLTHLQEFALTIHHGRPMLLDDALLGLLAASWKQLRSLKYQCHELASSNSSAGPALQSMSALERLNIRVLLGTYSVDGSFLPPSLTALCLRGVTLSSSSSLPRSLMQLKLSHCKLQCRCRSHTPCSGSLLSCLDRLEGLQSLFLRCYTPAVPLCGAGIEAMARLTSLRQLGLTVTAGVSLQALAALTKLTELTLEADLVKPPSTGEWHTTVRSLTALRRLRALLLGGQAAGIAAADLCRWRYQLQPYAAFCHVDSLPVIGGHFWGGE